VIASADYVGISPLFYLLGYRLNIMQIKGGTGNPHGIRLMLLQLSFQMPLPCFGMKGKINNARPMLRPGIDIGR
jgi:hypothetical protein